MRNRVVWSELDPIHPVSVSDSVHVIWINPNHEIVSGFHSALHNFLLKYPALDVE